NQTVRTNVFSANGNNGLEIAGDAWGVTVVPNIMGLNTRGDVAGEFGNFNDGILITGNAHDNMIGGTGQDQLSVIRQNTLSGNATTGSLPVQSPTLQLEALYVGWFGRAAGAAEFQTDMETVLTDILDGSSLGQAMLDISSAFANSLEDAPYAELASLTQPVTD